VKLVMKVGITIVIVLAVCILSRPVILWSMRESAAIPLPDNSGILTFIRQPQAAYSKANPHRNQLITMKR